MVRAANYLSENIFTYYIRTINIIVGLSIVAAVSCAQQPTEFKSISAFEFKQLLSKDSGVVLDVRTPGEYKNGHVAQSVLIDIMQADFEDKIKRLDKEQTYYIYCRSGNRSSKAASVMARLGFTKVYNVKDGINNILQSGVPVSKE